MKLLGWRAIRCYRNSRDVFPDEIPRSPPMRDIDFTIELVPGAAPVSKVLNFHMLS